MSGTVASTSTPPPGQRLVANSIFNSSVAGLLELIGIISADYGEKPIPAVSSPNDWDQRELTESIGRVQYPYMSLSINRFGRDYESYNQNLRNLGVNAKHALGNTISRYRLVPVNATFRVRYNTQDFNDVLRFCNRWVLAQKDARFILENEGLQIPVRVSLADDISIPPQDNAEYGLLFRVDTECTMKTYIGETEALPKLKTLVFTGNLYSIGKTSAQQDVEIPLAAVDTEVANT